MAVKLIKSTAEQTAELITNESVKSELLHSGFGFDLHSVINSEGVSSLILTSVLGDNLILELQKWKIKDEKDWEVSGFQSFSPPTYLMKIPSK